MGLITAAQAIDKLRRGEVVALPTETVYGLAGAIDSPSALKEIFALKNRPSFDPLIVHVADRGQARALCAEWPAIYDLLTDQFWPGPLTLVAKKTAAVSPVITSGLDTVALRSPDHPVMLSVLRGLGTPLAAPSANLFGRASPTTAAHVTSEFEGKVPVVDGGPCKIGVESTVVRAREEDGEWILSVLRPGGVSRQQLRNAISKSGRRFRVERAESAASPGHLKTHYQPAAPLVVLENRDWTAAVQREVEARLQRKLEGGVELRMPATPQEAARHLYEDFRRLSSIPDRAIWVRRCGSRSGEDWEVIWDRIERAASLTLS
jgi:L-threonylcarbamoyladenylate synthase